MSTDGKQPAAAASHHGRDGTAGRRKVVGLELSKSGQVAEEAAAAEGEKEEVVVVVVVEEEEEEEEEDEEEEARGGEACKWRQEAMLFRTSSSLRLQNRMWLPQDLAQKAL
jgi:hypothetical protein